MLMKFEHGVSFSAQPPRKQAIIESPLPPPMPVNLPHDAVLLSQSYTCPVAGIRRIQAEWEVKS